MYVDPTKKFNHISLCTGYGGIDLGLSRILPNLRTVAYCEIELYAIENLIAKMESELLPPCPIWSNLKTFPFEQFLGKVDFLSGGFPCQPFSDAGYKLGDEDPRHLFPFIKEGITKCRPAFVFLENVRGIITSTLRSNWGDDPKGTPVLLHVCRELERIGYEVEWGLFTARETGLPHRRQRVFILGKRKDITNSELARFSEYFQNSSKEHNQSCTNKNISMEQSKRNDDPTRCWASGETYILQRFAKGIGELATIESESIALPSGQDREQREYEPPRTLIRSIMDNANKVGFCRYDDEHPNQTPQDGRGQGRSEIDVANTQRNIQQVTQYEQQNDEGVEGVERSESQREQIYDQSEMGGDADGSSDWLDYERLCYSFSSVNDEIAMLGNGVVPATAEIAFRTLFNNFLI